MNKNILKSVILDQIQGFTNIPDFFVKRTVDKNFISSKKISVITGIRRSGKSTLLKQISKNFKNFYYFNFEDERVLDFSYDDFNNLLEIFFELFGESKVFFFDEIQNIFGWEKFVRRLFEDGYKIFITGSNSKLLSREMASALTGRHIRKELYPFSFSEFISFSNLEIKKNYNTKEKAKLKQFFNKYLEFGGFPEALLSQNKEELNQLYQDILIKDIIVRFKIKDSKSFRELSMYLLSNFGNVVSFNNLKNVLNFNSVSTVKSYCEFLEEAYINFLVFKYDYSIKKQIKNNRKTYSIDSGFINNLSQSFSENKGRLFENIVFLELKRRDKEIYYYKDIYECDFVVRNERKIESVIQVCSSLQDQNTRQREINGLISAMEEYNLRQGIIITFDDEEEIEIKNKKIIVLPIYKWLLNITN